MRRATGILSAAALAMVMVLSVSAPASAANTPARPAVADTEANKAMVTFFYDQLFNHGNFSVIDTFIGPVYIQHNPGLVDGAQALRDLVTGLRTRFPNSVNTIVRVVGQGDLVLIYHHSVGVPGTAGTAIMDVFRVSAGKIVEHWDVIQPVPENAQNNNTMF
jgi:predicted SnoaL-like aldol condensation-catalyzing enzyme